MKDELLAQQLLLDLTTVSIDPAWDVNKWTMSFGRDYGVRAERGDLRLIYSYLEQELTSTKSFDAILLPLHHGWNSLTPASREALVRRVREGCGLVLTQPLDAEVSPLVPATPITPPQDLDEPVRLGDGDKSPWKRTGPHYITRAIPLEAFPVEFLESNYVVARCNWINKPVVMDQRCHWSSTERQPLRVPSR